MKAEIPTAPTAERVLEALRTIEDPEVSLNMVDLGLIEEIRLSGGGIVEVDLIVTSPGCPSRTPSRKAPAK